MNRSWRESLLLALACAAPGYLPPRVRDLTDEDLCEAWHDSGAALHRARRATCRARVRRIAVLVEQRQEYLDELARRDPCGYLAYLTGGRVAEPEDLLRLL